jgi:hypothetical protein
MNRVKMAGPAGLEPVTSGVTGRRSNQLNYGPDIILDVKPVSSLDPGASPASSFQGRILRLFACRRLNLFKETGTGRRKAT